jgi:phosphoribosylformimino-5-aminoimidazole carboxamide ribotide isomerase
MRIIPAIDIIGGKCVRLSQGNYNQKTVYGDNPLDMAKRFEDAGINYLHLVDLDGAKSNSIVNYVVLEQIALKTNLKVDFGGGLKSSKDVEIAFNSGANQITLGSLAVSNQGLFFDLLKRYGPYKIILGADFLDGKIKTNGWLEDSGKDLINFVQDYVSKGVNYIIPTDISKDGMLDGPSFSIYKEILKNFKSVSLIASGGISVIQDLEELRSIGCEGAIIGKAIYENKIDLKSLTQFIEN